MYSKFPIDEIRTYVFNQFRSLPEEYKDLDSAETFSVKRIAESPNSDIFLFFIMI